MSTNKQVMNLLPPTVSKAAEFYASQFKWRVFPLFEVGPAGVCSCPKGSECKTPGKHPRISIPKGDNAVHPATNDVEQIKKWWRKWPHANIGVWLEGSDLVILDIDRNDKKDGFKGLAEIMLFEDKSEYPKTLTCKTPSGGLHLYFKFVEGVPNKANALGPGLDTWHSKHYVIVPPSNHVKGQYVWDVTVSDAPGPYPDWLKPKDRAAAAGVRKKVGRPEKEKLDPSDPDDLERLNHALKYVDATNRDRWVLVGFALARAFDWKDDGFAVYDAWSASAHNYDEAKTREQYYRQSKVVPKTPITTASIFEWAKEHPDYKGWAREDTRPFEIRERPDNEVGVLGEMAELLPHFPIYQRSSKLFEIVPIAADEKSDDGEWRPKGSYVLREVDSLQLSTRIYPTLVRWMRKGAKGWKATDVSQKLCGAFLGIGNWPTSKKLRAFVQHPTLRDDGSLLQTKGYDQKSGLYLTEEIDINVKPKPTKADARKAFTALMQPFSEYKWSDGVLSQAGLAAALFTVGVRHMFDDGVPLFAIDAPRAGSGKSKLAQAISILWFGHPATATPYTPDNEELTKRLAAILLKGDRVVMFDNVHPSIRVNDPTLNAVITGGRMSFRELGTQRTLDLDATATFFMTGNSLKIVGDMIRRTIKIQIDPGGLHPHDRKFKIDPLEDYILKHRNELISNALTVLRAFFVAGKPKMSGGDPAIASFEKWSNMIRELLLWLELDDVKECIHQGYDQDDESLEIDHLLRLLFDIPDLYDKGLPSAMFLPLIENNKKLKEAFLPFLSERHSFSGVNHPRIVNTVLSHVAKIPIDGKRLVRLGPVWLIREQET